MSAMKAETVHDMSPVPGRLQALKSLLTDSYLGHHAMPPLMNNSRDLFVKTLLRYISTQSYSSVLQKKKKSLRRAYFSLSLAAGPACRCQQQMLVKLYPVTIHCFHRARFFMVPFVHSPLVSCLVH